MNCKDISSILDDRDIGGLTADERAAVDRHLAGCAECAAEWRVHERLSMRRVPAAANDFRQRVRHALVRGERRSSRAARAGRAGLVGGLLLVGAAAAMVATQTWQTWQSGPRRAADAERTTATADTRPERAAVGPDAEQLESSERAAQQTTRGSRALEDAGEAPRADAFGSARSPRERVRMLQRCAAAPADPAMRRLVLLPLRHENPNTVAIAATEDLYAAFLLELRAVPNLDTVPLTAEDVARAVAAGAPNECPTDPNQAIARHFGADRYISFVNARADQVEPEHPDAWLLEFMFRGPIGGGTGGTTGAPSRPWNVASIVEDWIGEFLPRLFPLPRDATASELEALVTEAHTLELVRLDALRRLAGRGGDALSASVIDAAVELTALAQDPEVRREVWQIMKSAANEALLPPLLDALVYDPSDAVRREAATTLSELADDPAVRAALERAASSDASPDVRGRARWSLLDDDGRRELIVATLLDRTLSDSERLEPLRNNDARRNADFVALTIDGDARDALVEIATRAADPVTRMAALTELSEGWAVRLESPDVYLDRLSNDPDERVRLAAAQALRGYADLAEIRAALDAAGMSDPPAGNPSSTGPNIIFGQ